MKKWIYLGLLLFPLLGHAEYVIHGQVNLSTHWQNQIFLATIDRLDHYYKSDPNNIINVATIDSTGTFILSGDNLPLQQQYYRLFLIKETSSEFDACLYVGGDDHNFVHIMLDNETHLEISADPAYTSPFGNYNVVANLENQLMRDLNRLVHPSYYFYPLITGLSCLLSIGLFLRNRQLTSRIKSALDTPKVVVDDVPIRLTKQEQKILSLIVEGKSNKDIASDLYVEVSTVKTHINKLYSKLKVNNRSDAISMGKNLVNTGV